MQNMELRLGRKKNCKIYYMHDSLDHQGCDRNPSPTYTDQPNYNYRYRYFSKRYRFNIHFIIVVNFNSENELQVYYCDVSCKYRKLNENTLWGRIWQI